MVQFLIIDFLQNICDYDYHIIRLLCRNNTSLHCSMLSTCCIKATVPSIRYLTDKKIGLPFHLNNWQLTLVCFCCENFNLSTGSIRNIEIRIYVYL